MKIDHLAIWTSDLEKLKIFYCQYFGGESGALYHNPAKNYTSYFISFPEGCRLELMHRPEIPAHLSPPNAEYKGLTHFAFQLDSRAAVDKLTSRLEQAGYAVLGQPRTTGDGYYESIVADPEGNRVELMA